MLRFLVLHGKLKVIVIYFYLQSSEAATERCSLEKVFFFFFFFQLLYLELGFLSVAYLTVANLARLGISVHFRSQLGPSIQSDSSPSAGLQVVTQSTHLSKDCYPQLVSNPHRSEIRPPKQLDYRCMKNCNEGLQKLQKFQ